MLRFGLADSSSHKGVVYGLIRFIVDAGDPAFEGLRVGEAVEDVELHACGGEAFYGLLMLLREGG